MYSYMIERDYEEDDFLNKKKKRNIKNVPKSCYNCGGYALGCFSWYLPHEEDTYLDETTLEENIQFMLNDFPELKVIQSLNELQENEYPILFRRGDDIADFHFVKRGKNGIWYHKRGASQEIEKMTEEEAFSSNWEDVYDGELVLFAMRES